MAAAKWVPVNAAMRMVAKGIMMVNNVDGNLTWQRFGLNSLSLTRLIN